MTLTWVTLVAAGLALLASFLSLYLYRQTGGHLSRLFAETGHDEFGEVLLSHQRQLRRGSASLKEFDQRLTHVEAEQHFLLNQTGLVRYNPFSDAGGNMSFSLALLNNNGDGAVVTSLHSREGTRLYAKQVVNYESEQILTNEEKEAVTRAKRTINP